MNFFVFISVPVKRGPPVGMPGGPKRGKYFYKIKIN